MSVQDDRRHLLDALEAQLRNRDGRIRPSVLWRLVNALHDIEAGRDPGPWFRELTAYKRPGRPRRSALQLQAVYCLVGYAESRFQTFERDTRAAADAATAALITTDEVEVADLAGRIAQWRRKPWPRLREVVERMRDAGPSEMYLVDWRCAVHDLIEANPELRTWLTDSPPRP